MSKTALNLFPARVAIGILQDDGSVLMTAEFSRAMRDLLARVGGPSSLDMQEVAALASSDAADAQAMSLRSDVDALRVSADPAALAALRAEVDELRALLGQVGPALALYHQVEAMRAELAMIEDPAAQVHYIATRYAPLLSPHFQGTPTAPTATAGTSTDQIATTAFVQNKQDKITPGTVTGSRGGNAALASLLTALADENLIVNSTTA